MGRFLHTTECFLRCYTLLIHLDSIVCFNGSGEGEWPKHCRDSLGPFAFGMEEDGSGSIAGRFDPSFCNTILVMSTNTAVGELLVKALTIRLEIFFVKPAVISSVTFDVDTEASGSAFILVFCS